MGCRHKNDFTISCSCSGNGTSTGTTGEEISERGIPYGAGTGWFFEVEISAVHNVTYDIQVVLAYPFLLTNGKGYVGRAFEFSRQFLWRWTVNWRFVKEEQFLSRKFSLILAISNLGILLTFFVTRWIRPSGLSVPKFVSAIVRTLSPETQQPSSHQVTPSFILTTILTSMTIGMLCARSLHYQFYTYIAWSTPYLLWKSGMHPIMIYATWATQEWAWNVYPSTPLSSAAVVGCLSIQVVCCWWGTRNDFADVSIPRETPKKHQHTE